MIFKIQNHTIEVRSGITGVGVEMNGIQIRHFYYEQGTNGNQGSVMTEANDLANKLKLAIENAPKT